MTTWPDEAGDAELDVMDPTAAPTGDEDDRRGDDRHEESRASGAATSPAPTTSASDPDDFSPDGAVSDPTGAVHVWLDADKRVTQVRISNRWRARLKKKPLAEAVGEVIRSHQAIARLPRHGHTSIDHPAAPLSHAALDRLMEKSVELDTEAAELAGREDVTPTRFVGDDRTGTSANRRVEVTLDLHAKTTAIRIDPDWVGQATAADLSESLGQAHAAAYADWTPPVVEPGEWDRLNDQRADVVAEIMAMFRRGL